MHLESLVPPPNQKCWKCRVQYAASRSLPLPTCPAIILRRMPLIYGVAGVRVQPRIRFTSRRSRPQAHHITSSSSLASLRLLHWEVALLALAYCFWRVDRRPVAAQPRVSMCWSAARSGRVSIAQTSHWLRGIVFLATRLTAPSVTIQDFEEGGGFGFVGLVEIGCHNARASRRAELDVVRMPFVDLSAPIVLPGGNC